MSRTIDEWLKWVRLTSVPLRRIDANDAMKSVASGCLIDFAQGRLVLSVGHAIGSHPADWVLEVAQELSGGTQICQLPAFESVAESTPEDPQPRLIDFCYTSISKTIVPRYRHVSLQGQIVEDLPRHVFDADLVGSPDANQVYAFSGQIHADQIDIDTYVADVVVYPGLKYVGDNGAYHVFRLPVEHPGHEHFHGCSGAPIVDTNKNVVALVCSGDKDSNTVTAVSISRYKSVLQLFSTLKSRAN